MKFVIHRFFLLLSCLYAVSSGQVFAMDLEPGKWYLLSAPGNTVEPIPYLFSGELAVADFGSTWTVFTFDNPSQIYIQSSATDVLQTSEAFWFVHYSSSAIVYDLPTDSLGAVLAQSPGCISELGCFEYSLPVGSGVSWAMLGAPFYEGVVINDMRLVTESGPCQSGCTINQSYQSNLSGDTFYSYNAGTDSYDALSGNDLLFAGDGHWFPISIPPEFGSAKLVMPTFCSPTSV